MLLDSVAGKPSKDIATWHNLHMPSKLEESFKALDHFEVHHYPPKEMAADVGYPVRGGQTLLIARIPSLQAWEVSAVPGLLPLGGL